MTLISKAAQGEATVADLKPAQKLRQKQRPNEPENARSRSPKSKARKKKPPQLIFDAKATLKILVGASMSKAAEHADQFPSSPSNAAADLLLSSEEQQSLSTSALATLEVARNSLSTQLRHYDDDDDDMELADEDRLPQTEAELEQELAWLRRKVASTREDARKEETALRERAAQQGKELLKSDYLTDPRVMEARHRNGRYSRRQVALLKLRKPGAKFGPPLPDDEEGAASPTGGPSAGAAFGGSVLEGEQGTAEAAAVAAAAALGPSSHASSPHRAWQADAQAQLLLQPDEERKKPKPVAWGEGSISAALGGTISMFEHAASRHRRQLAEREAALERQKAEERARKSAAAERRQQRRSREALVRQQRRSKEAPMIETNGRAPSQPSPSNHLVRGGGRAEPAHPANPAATRGPSLAHVAPSASGPALAIAAPFKMVLAAT